MKTCSKCRVLKPEGAFSPSKLTRDGYYCYCRECKSRMNLEYNHRPDVKARHNAGQREYYRRPEVQRALREKRLAKEYGISVAEVERIFKSQSGRCGICDSADAKRLVIDHNHTTGKVRGLLCDPCNKGIGSLRDDPTRILAAFNYLVSHDEVDFVDPIVRDIKRSEAVRI